MTQWILTKLNQLINFILGFLVTIYILLLTAPRQLSFKNDHGTGKNILIWFLTPIWLSECGSLHCKQSYSMWCTSSSLLKQDITPICVVWKQDN